MRRLILPLCSAAIALGGAASAADAASLCVGHGPRCHPTIQAALDTSHDGDTIHLGRGTFAGGITIDRSVRLIGAGRGATIIRGGGPVVTIGAFDAPTEPTVTIKRVTITGGVTNSSAHCGPNCGADYVQATALGGGIEVPPAAGSATGATVTLSDSAVTGNRVAPVVTVPHESADCPDEPCRFAVAGGGGIDNWGTMTLKNTTVSDNEVGGPLASSADGAGILSDGSLTLRNSAVEGNRAIASAPNGRFAVGGGIFVTDGALALSIDTSVVRDNSATLTSVFPRGVGMDAHAGGIHVGDGVPTRVERTAIIDNTVTATDPFGEPVAFDSGMSVGCSPLVMRDSVVSGNRVTGTSATSAGVGPGGSALELNGGGTITGTRITANASTAISAGGIAAVNGGLAVLNFDDCDPKLVVVRDSVISGNLAVASSTTGTANVMGGGIFNNSLLELDDVTIRGNSGRALAPAGVAQGGGIWNGVLLALGSGSTGQLALHDTTVTHNAVSGSPGLGLTVQGGGLFTTAPVTLDDSVIAKNTPDQCYGCSTPRATTAQSASKPTRTRRQAGRWPGMTR
jgi:hypothetical protein